VGALEEAAPGVMKAPDLSASGAIFVKEDAGPPNTSDGQPKESVPKGIGVVKEGLKQTKKFDFFGYIDRAPYDGVRKAVGEHMVKSMFTIPHVTHTDMADVTDLWALREKAKVKAEIEGIKLTFLPYFISAACAALKKHPYVNAELNEKERTIILKKYYNIGIAVDTEEGLMVPVIKGAEAKSINDIAKEIDELAQKARTRKINPMDMKGGTFTITNIGSAGGGWFATPVIHYPQAAVLATGMIMDMAVPVNGKVEIRKMLPLSLAFDHRIFDGAEAARFVNALKDNLANPAK
jgi:pyruvate dehydrogenase E2 component (dihydrolipoamide acetyltransferase)